jgi:hypothetical protein
MRSRRDRRSRTHWGSCAASAVPGRRFTSDPAKASGKRACLVEAYR